MSKPAIKSKGMQGSAIAAIGSLGSIFLLLQAPEFHQQSAQCLQIFGQGDLAQKILALSPAIALLGSLFSAYGRYDAGGVKIFGKSR